MLLCCVSMCICIYIDGKLTKSYLLEFRLTSTKTMHGDFSDEKNLSYHTFHPCVWGSGKCVGIWEQESITETVVRKWIFQTSLIFQVQVLR